MSDHHKEEAHKHDHSGGHSHGHHHVKDMSGRKLLWVTLLNVTITLAQFIGGLISNSLALLSDALHNLGDSSAILIAFFANKLSKRSADEKNTFGYKRFEIVAAFFNAIVLIGICLFLFVEAYHRFVNPQPIKGLIMLIVATVGLFGNLFSVLILQKDRKENLNVKAAYLHLMGDTLSSVAVIIGGIFMWKFEIYWIDPLITVLVSVYIIYHTWHVLSESFGILMQAKPPEIDIKDIKENLERLDDVKDIHHVHVWRLNDSKLFLEAHVNIKTNVLVSETEKLRNKVEHILQDKFSITHVTLQVEYNGCKKNNNFSKKEQIKTNNNETSTSK